MTVDVLGLDPATRVLTKVFTNAQDAGSIRLPEVAASYRADCDVVLVAVPKGEGTIFQARLWHELCGSDDDA